MCRQWRNGHHIAGLCWRDGPVVRLRNSCFGGWSSRHIAERNTRSDSENIIDDVSHAVEDLPASGINDQSDQWRLSVPEPRCHVQHDRDLDWRAEDFEHAVVYDDL